MILIRIIRGRAVGSGDKAIDKDFLQKMNRMRPSGGSNDSSVVLIEVELFMFNSWPLASTESYDLVKKEWLTTAEIWIE